MTVQDPVVPPELVARFRAAEAQLYPLVLGDAELFERSTALVGLLVADLRTCPDGPALLARVATALDGLPQRVLEAGLHISGVPVEVVVDAAAALRCRELEAERARARRQGEATPADGAAADGAAADGAAADGASWSVEDSAPALAMSGLIWRRERHLATGATLFTRTELTDDGMVFGIEVSPGAARGVEALDRTYASRAEWLAAAAELRARIGGPEPTSAPRAS